MDPNNGPTTMDHSPLVDAVSNDCPPPADHPLYSPEQEAYLKSIEQEAATLFPSGKIFVSIKQLREELRQFGHKKGFVFATGSSKLHCTRCDEPKYRKTCREKKNHAGLVPVEKRRTYRSSTRCGCPFQITFAPVQRQDKTANPSRLPNRVSTNTAMGVSHHVTNL
jgi:hypothetical protein